MIIGHIPAGYIFSNLAYGRFSSSICGYRAFLGWGIFGAIAPDLDLLFFYFAEHRHIHHHEYFTHYPITWLALILLSAAVIFRKPKRRTAGYYLLIFSVSGFLHLILDTIGGNIWWLAPLADHPFSLVTVLPGFRVWQLNFLLHWSFAIELILAAWAARLWLKKNPFRNPSKGANGAGIRHPIRSPGAIDRHTPVFSSNRPS